LLLWGGGSGIPFFRRQAFNSNPRRDAVIAIDAGDRVRPLRLCGLEALLGCPIGSFRFSRKLLTIACAQDRLIWAGAI
jgi:hypothetical protein